MTRQTWRFLVAVVGMAFLVGCGKSPLSPTDTTSLVAERPSIRVVPASSVVAPGRQEGHIQLSTVTGDPITITVQQIPSITTTVNPGETAILTGLPPGAYTLVFTQNGNVIATQPIVGVQPGEEIHITVVFDGGSFVLVVVVIGTSPTPAPQPCTVDGTSVGGSLNVEGDVVSGDGSTFVLDRNGSHGQDLYQVYASAASYRCVGQAKGGSCKAGLKSGAQVHVTGTLLGCFANSVALAATEVKVQKP